MNELLKALYDGFYAPLPAAKLKAEIEACHQELIERLEKPERMHTPLKKCSLTADDGASPPLKWCTNSAEMVHGGRRRGARGRHAGNHSGMPLRLRMDSPSIWMV